MTKKICLSTILLLAFVTVGCTKENQTTASDNANANATASNATASQSPTEIKTAGPDNSEITTNVSPEGTRTETRVFHNNRRISRVVVTTDNGTKTVRATSPSGEEKVVNTTEDVLHATGDKVADAAGFVADKSKAVAGEVGDKAEDVKDKTVSTTKKVANEAGDKAEDVKDKTVSTSKTVGEKTVEGAKKVGSKTVSGAKKAGSAVKKVIP